MTQEGSKPQRMKATRTITALALCIGMLSGSPSRASLQPTFERQEYASAWWFVPNGRKETRTLYTIEVSRYAEVGGSASKTMVEVGHGNCRIIEGSHGEPKFKCRLDRYRRMKIPDADFQMSTHAESAEVRFKLGKRHTSILWQAKPDDPARTTAPVCRLFVRILPGARAERVAGWRRLPIFR